MKIKIVSQGTGDTTFIQTEDGKCLGDIIAIEIDPILPNKSITGCLHFRRMPLEISNLEIKEKKFHTARATNWFYFYYVKMSLRQMINKIIIILNKVRQKIKSIISDISEWLGSYVG